MLRKSGQDFENARDLADERDSEVVLDEVGGGKAGFENHLTTTLKKESTL